MIFLDYLYNLPNATSGLDTIATQTITSFPTFIPVLLLFVFLIVFIGGITSQRARTGTSDYAVWSVIASISIFLITLLFSVTSGFIKLDLLVIVTVITIFSGVWLFLDRRTSEE